MIPEDQKSMTTQASENMLLNRPSITVNEKDTDTIEVKTKKI